jgi:acetoin utilization protein AcuB
MKHTEQTRSTARKGLTVSDVMTAQPLTIGRAQPLAVAHQMMRDHRCRHLPVLEHGELVGILSQRDLYFLESLGSFDLEKDKVDDAMTEECYAVPPDAPLADVARTMAENRYGCAVVMERDRVIGIFTATDALRVLGGQQRSPGSLS